MVKSDTQMKRGPSSLSCILHGTHYTPRLGVEQTVTDANL